MHRKIFFNLILLIVWFIFSTNHIFASDYVLPYPSFMPGYPLYKVSEFYDAAKQIWSFGNIAKFKYHLSIADKKLVEAKTLFEYQQYLLAARAISTYTLHIDLAGRSMNEAKKEGKNITEKKIILQRAIKKHEEILKKLKEEQPKQFVWKPEKDRPETIEIEKILDNAIKWGSKWIE